MTKLTNCSIMASAACRYNATPVGRMGLWVGGLQALVSAPAARPTLTAPARPLRIPPRPPARTHPSPPQPQQESPGERRRARRICARRRRSSLPRRVPAGSGTVAGDPRLETLAASRGIRRGGRRAEGGRWVGSGWRRWWGWEEGTSEREGAIAVGNGGR